MLVVLLVTVSRMPDDNPLKRIMIGLNYRAGATAAAGMLAIPATPIPAMTPSPTSALQSSCYGIGAHSYAICARAGQSR